MNLLTFESTTEHILNEIIRNVTGIPSGPL